MANEQFAEEYSAAQADYLEKYNQAVEAAKLLKEAYSTLSATGTEIKKSYEQLDQIRDSALRSRLVEQDLKVCYIIRDEVHQEKGQSGAEKVGIFSADKLKLLYFNHTDWKVPYHDSLGGSQGLRQLCPDHFPNPPRGAWFYGPSYIPLLGIEAEAKATNDGYLVEIGTIDWPRVDQRSEGRKIGRQKVKDAVKDLGIKTLKVTPQEGNKIKFDPIILKDKDIATPRIFPEEMYTYLGLPKLPDYTGYLPSFREFDRFLSRLNLSENSE